MRTVLSAQLLQKLKQSHSHQCTKLFIILTEVLPCNNNVETLDAGSEQGCHTNGTQSKARNPFCSTRHASRVRTSENLVEVSKQRYIESCLITLHVRAQCRRCCLDEALSPRRCMKIEAVCWAVALSPARIIESAFRHCCHWLQYALTVRCHIDHGI